MKDYYLNINSRIKFEEPMGKNIFWIPINTLGTSRFTYSDILDLVHESPENKQKKINTLLEAIQLFQVSKFQESEDNIFVENEGIVWEYHKPGKYAVSSNTGCCASTTSWLLYMLKGKYEQLGVFSVFRETGGGHALNYIKYNGWYYFIDMLSHIEKYAINATPETGNKKDFVKSLYSTGIFLKSKSILDFITYYNRFTLNLKIEHLYYYYDVKEEVCCPISSKNDGKRLYCILPREYGINIYEEKLKNICVNFEEAFNPCIKWNI